jgi:hypothetical protein
MPDTQPTLPTMPDGTYIISVKNGIWITLANGMEIYGLFFQASEFSRHDDVYHARFTHVHVVDHWVELEPNGITTIPGTNLAGYTWKKARDPIITEDPIDLNALRALLRKDDFKEKQE